MPWFRAVMTSWMYERAKRHMYRNTEAYQSFQLDIGPGAYKRAFLTHINAVTTAVKRVAGAPCVTEAEKREVLRADLERNVSLCLHNSFCRNREQKVNVDLLPCCKPRLLEKESWGTARNSIDMLEKFYLGHSSWCKFCENVEKAVRCSMMPFVRRSELRWKRQKFSNAICKVACRELQLYLTITRCYAINKDIDGDCPGSMCHSDRLAQQPSDATKK